MDGRKLKFVLIGFGIVATMGFMLLVATQKSDGGFAYYVTVKEYLEKGGGTGHFRVNGKVAPGSIERRPDGQRVLFTIVDADGGPSLAVDYTGVIPDTFVDDANVVVEGRRRDDGVFSATTLLAKCPSKYEKATVPARSAS
ncbi:MAG TPA: cytochrome c maturation protein CcmE [Candidatus Sulfotelmatobacter sp.]|jgi:cytochrome c-type biogenesis protein CcmE|nr:cytochrome c maturation protein CcmE [Candidatus Sulfotelmatobacter sp.]